MVSASGSTSRLLLWNPLIMEMEMVTCKYKKKQTLSSLGAFRQCFITATRKELNSKWGSPLPLYENYLRLRDVSPSMHEKGLLRQPGLSKSTLWPQHVPYTRETRQIRQRRQSILLLCFDCQEHGINHFPQSRASCPTDSHCTRSLSF